MSLIGRRDILNFIDVHQLMGRGPGWVDVHLLAATFVSRERPWTRDRRLAEAASGLGVAV